MQHIDKHRIFQVLTLMLQYTDERQTLYFFLLIRSHNKLIIHKILQNLYNINKDNLFSSFGSHKTIPYTLVFVKGVKIAMLYNSIYIFDLNNYTISKQGVILTFAQLSPHFIHV